MSGDAGQGEERDPYDVFLDTWEPGERLLHATLPQNLGDPFARQRLLEDSSGAAPLERTAFADGPKIMTANELRPRFLLGPTERMVRWFPRLCSE